MINRLPKSILDILFLSIGAMPGAIVSWKINNYILCNIIGSMLLGMFSRFNLNRRLNLILSIGLCGSLTTFSGWIYESGKLFLEGLLIRMLILIFTQLLLGVFASLLGMILAKMLIIRLKQPL